MLTWTSRTGRVTIITIGGDVVRAVARLRRKHGCINSDHVTVYALRSPASEGELCYRWYTPQGVIRYWIRRLVNRAHD
jgi:hypothetical protein